MLGLMCRVQGHNAVAPVRLEAGDWDCVAAVEHLPALHYSVDFIFFVFCGHGFRCGTLKLLESQ